MTMNKWLRIGGLAVNSLIAGLMIFAGSGKALGFVPPEVLEKMKAIGHEHKMR